MKKEKKFTVRKMTVIGVLGGISVVLGMTPLGFIPIGPTRATIMHIPVIIGALVEGPLVGGMVGLIFGLFSIFQAMTNPTPVSFVFLNPLISILPRVLIGLVSYYVYSGLRKIKIQKNLDIIIASIVGSLTNTMGVLLMIYFLYGENFVEGIGGNPILAKRIILGLGISNGIPEAIIGVIITTSVVGALKSKR